MIEFKRFIYLDVYRTGSTHLIHALRRMAACREIRLWRHAPITRAGFLVRPGGRLVFTSVRNPWDWYVSLWAHGADGHSAIRRFLLQKLPVAEVKLLYDQSDPAASFRRWLARVHDPSFIDAHLEERYPQSRLSPVIGLYTYRFQRVTTRFPWFFLRRRYLSSPEAVVEYHHRRKAYMRFLRTESLTADVAAIVSEHAPMFREDAQEILHQVSRRRRNSSTRHLAHYRDYYDESSAQLVAERDRFFLDEFGYRF